jgi:hypothetical protein
MAGYRPVFVRVDEKGVQRFISPGGDVWDLIDDIAVRTAQNAVAILILGGHVRKGHAGGLIGNITANNPKRTAPFGIQAAVWANVRHAVIVHEGSKAQITAGGKFMPVPTNRRAIHRGSVLAAAGDRGAYGLHKRVSGQRAIKYLDKGLGLAMASKRF